MAEHYSKKVFHGLQNYGTQAGFLAKGLRRLGVEARSYVSPDSFKREADFNLKKVSGNGRTFWFHLVYNFLLKVKCLFKYDVFHFYYGTSLLPYHLDLPVIKLMGKKVVHHYLGHDVELYKETKERYEFSNMDFWEDHKGAIYDAKIKKRFNYEKKFSDFQIVCAPQYSPFVPGATFVPLAIDLDCYQYVPLKAKDYSKEPVTILHAPTKRGVKGTKFLIEAVEILRKEGFMVELKICEGITHQQLMIEYQTADFSVVSLLGGWYGTAGIEAMATGRGIIAFLRDEYFMYVEDTFKEALPIISADKNTIYECLKEILKKGGYQDWGARSRRFVEKYHDMKKVSVSVLEIYKSLDG